VISIVTEHNPVGRPSREPKPKRITVKWVVQAEPVVRNETRIDQQRQKEETFCLLTNVAPDVLNSREVLIQYKGQSKVEHLFSVLKSPLLASTLFLEKPERIEAMMTIFYFSVLMHGILQLISRTRIASCKEPPRLGPENRPLIRPRSDTMLNILALFEIISEGDAVSLRCKLPDRAPHLELILFLVNFDPSKI